jgi:DNA primase
MEFAHLATQERRVSLGSSFELKERVKQATDIVELVGSYLQLRRQGRQYVALCPWHDDSRPSLTINPERQSFRCWVCNIGGDVFSFIMQMEGVTFPEALAMLAERAGIPLKTERPTAQPRSGNAPPDKRLLYRVMAWVEKQYHTCLTELPEGEPGRKYLQERQISAESIEQFHLGFCPDQWDWILRRAEDRGPNAKLLEAVGVLLRGAGGTGRYYDRFKGRVMFSIRDTQGRPVGTGGRILPENMATNPAKYVNSPETPLFSKSRLLYGLDVARDAVRRSNRVLVMEGYTDCILAHQCGFHDAVAVLGTALGEGHLRILKRFADKIVLVLDGDEAGQKRANEVLELFVAQQVDLRILTLPEEFDPCEFLLERGAEAFGALVEQQAVDALEHAFRVATRNVDVERDVHGASQAMEKLLATIAKAPRHRDDTTREDRLREEKILQRLAARFRIEEQEVRARLTELRRRSHAPPPARMPGAPPEAIPPEKIDPWERELLEVLVQHPECVPQAQGAIRPEELASRACRRIFETCCRLHAAGELPTFDRLILEFDEPVLKGLLVEFDEQAVAKGSHATNPDPQILLEELIRGFERRRIEKRRPAQVLALREGNLDTAQQDELLARIVQEQRARQGISRPTDG